MKEDSQAETDMNIIMNEHGGFIEIQGTAEGQQSFNKQQLDTMLEYAQTGIRELIALQKQAMVALKG
jgi:ribonuclease PH